MQRIRRVFDYFQSNTWKENANGKPLLSKKESEKVEKLLDIDGARREDVLQLRKAVRVSSGPQGAFSADPGTEVSGGKSRLNFKVDFQLLQREATKTNVGRFCLLQALLTSEKRALEAVVEREGEILENDEVLPEFGEEEGDVEVSEEGSDEDEDEGNEEEDDD
jgi:hypothetical protein